MISTREFSELLLSIRSSATNFSNWEGFLDQLSRLTEARAALVILRRPEAGINKIVALGGTHSASERASLYVNSQKLYAECYGSQDPFHAALMRSRLKGVIPGEALIPSQLLRHSDMYQSLLAPNDLEHVSRFFDTLKQSSP
jgi:hypothetical protein